MNAVQDPAESFIHHALDANNFLPLGGNKQKLLPSPASFE